MRDNNKSEFLKNLLITPSPTGFEAKGQQIWMDYVGQFADEIEADSYGSAYGRVNVDTDAITVMLEAHCDEIGMMINYIDDNGFIYVTRLGGSDPSITRAKKINIHTKEGIVTGVIGNTAIHLQDKEQKSKTPSWSDIFIDIGVSNKEEALKLVQVGDPITYAEDFEYLNDEIIAGRALDNRIGGYIIARTLEELSNQKADLKVNVLALNSVQEEIGGFGARMMSYRLMPDIALVTDVTHATDSPGINLKEHGLVTLGGGPTITHGSANHPLIVKKIEAVAKEKNITIQHEATSNRTGTDTDSIFYQQTGISSALISMPLRYMHSPVEMVSMKDVDQLINLMTQTVLSLKKGEQFRVI
ncbi:MAG TPA: M42 family metallopeptidase [Balneolales bacterium]|nr:M42 family metallopeptidase [Balneolales bacterium]